MKIRLVRLDAADEAAWLKFGQEFEATIHQGSGSTYFEVADPRDGFYYFFRADQVEAV